MLKLHILQLLDRVEGDGLSATSLRTELSIVKRQTIGEQAMAAALTEMRNQGLILGEEDDMTGDTIWKLTPAGTARARA